MPISRLYSPCLNVCSRRSIRSEKYCVPRNFVDSSSSSTPDRGPRFKAQSVAMWRHVQCGEVRASESLYLMRQHALYLETGERTVNLLHFLLPTKLLSCTRSSDRGNNEVSVVRVQGRYKLLTTWIMEWDN